MAPRLPTVSARDVVKALERAGFVFERQKGSHATWRHPNKRHTTVVPMHPGNIKRPLLKQIIRDAGLSEDEFRELL